MVSGKVARIIIKKNYLEFLEYLYSDLHISKIVCIFAGENNIKKNFDINKLSSCWQWQEKGNSWRGVGIYHVTASAMIRHPQKAAFGELKWQVVDGQIDGAYVEW